MAISSFKWGTRVRLQGSEISLFGEFSHNRTCFISTHCNLHIKDLEQRSRSWKVLNFKNILPPELHLLGPDF